VKLGSVQPVAGEPIEVDVSMEAVPAVLYDALVLPDGSDAVEALRTDGRTLEFIKDQYRHCKPMLVAGASRTLLDACGIPTAPAAGQPDAGLIIVADAGAAADDFVAAMARHRHFSRETDPPRV
jgi:catalase